MLIVWPSVRQAIRNNVYVFDADDLPSFLWENETADVSDLKKGFLRGGILVRVRTLTPPPFV